MPDWFATAGDTRRQFTTLTDGSGAPLDLSAMAARLRVAEATLGRRHRYTKDGVIVQAGASPNFTDKGIVAYDPAPADVAAPGDYLCQWQLTDAGGKLRTVPDQAPFVWRIESRIE